MKVLRYGRRALLVECTDIDEVAALHTDLLRRRADGLLPACDDIVPAETTILIDGLDDAGTLAADLAAWRPGPSPATDSGSPATAEPLHIPVRYNGPDLDSVAESWQTSTEGAIRIHADLEFRVAFCGFAPGFAYLTGLPARYHLPRRSTPRTTVPPGSVAVAGPYTGIYPRSSPGGWHLIGSTDAPLWDLKRPNPALLSPGARVRFDIRPQS